MMMSSDNECKFVLEQRAITRPYFDKFNYKATIPNPAEYLYPREIWDMNEPYDDYQRGIKRSTRSYYNSCEKFLSRFIEFFSDIDCEDFRHGLTTTSHSFYFVHEEDFRAFIADYSSEITVINLPPEGYDESKLESEFFFKTHVRDPFFGSHPFKVSFNPFECDEFDDWVGIVFSGDTDRCRYEPTNKERVLYLADDIDVALVKLSYARHIRNIEQTVN